jgi:regulator of replication initiation timing
MELNQKDEAIRQIDIDVREMQCHIEREEAANSLLRTENDGLRRDLESMRNAEEMHRQLKNQYDNER